MPDLNSTRDSYHKSHHITQTCCKKNEHKALSCDFATKIKKFPDFLHLTEPLFLAVFVNTAAKNKKTGEDYKPARSDSGKGEKLQVRIRESFHGFPSNGNINKGPLDYSGFSGEGNDCQVSCIIFLIFFHYVIMRVTWDTF